MILKRLSLLLSLSLVLLVSCESTDPNHLEQEKLHDAVMVVHDEVMPRMGEMNKLRKGLKKLVENDASMEEPLKQEIMNAVTALEKADDGMMDWMAAYNKPSKLRGDKSHEEIMTFLKSEMKKVDKVKEDMLGSIEKAKNLLAQNSQ